MKKKKDQTTQKEIADVWVKNAEVPSDVLGSYTGTPSSNNSSDRYEKPIQDADDL